MKSEDEAKMYQKRTFTDEGLSSLEGFAETLILIYKDPNTEYPVKLGLIFGIPMMTHSQHIMSKELMFERIKVIAQLLGRNQFRIQTGENTFTTFKLGDAQ